MAARARRGRRSAPVFDYPSLLLYVLAPSQLWSDAPSFLAARGVAAAIGVAGVAAAWWLGARAYGTVAGAVAAATTAVASVHVAYSHMAVTDVLMTLGITIALALLIADRVELAGLAGGIAMGAKWPAAILLVPLVVVAWGRWARLAAAVALFVLAFAGTTPFMFVHAGEAAGDAWRVQRLAHQGWLGFEDDPWAPVAFAHHLWDSLGPVLLVGAVALVFALVRRSRADLVLASFALAYYLNLATLSSHFDRYVLPLIPVLGALAGRFRAVAPATLLLLVVPLTSSVRADRELTRTDTRVRAHAWIDANVPAGTRVALDPSAPEVEDLDLLRLALPGPGRDFDENRDVARLRVRGVRYVVVTGAVTDRVLAAREQYPRESAFYDELRRRTPAYELRPGGDLGGPWVAVYRL